MSKTLIVLPDGTEVTSGIVGRDAIFSSTLTECVNDSEELSIGSTCANMLEATIWNPGGRLTINAGDELELYDVEKDGTRYKVGIFITEAPTRPSKNTMKITCYDRVTKLDKDLTEWLLSLNGWPYTLLTFAQMVCEQCGLVLANDTIPNQDFPVRQYTKAGTTGRMLMQWIGEVCARFCRANTDGEIEFAWYQICDTTYRRSGKTEKDTDGFYYSGSLTFEDYDIAPVEAVQIQLADSKDGYLFPQVAEGLNSYVITGNPFLNAVVTTEVEPYLEVILSKLNTYIDEAGEERDVRLNYSPCKFTAPAKADIHAGNIVAVEPPNNKPVMWVRCMKKVRKGQRDTLESTGSARRDTTSAQHSAGKVPEQTETPTPEELIEILTNGGEIEGIFFRDGQLYINASYIYSGVISSVDGLAKFDLDNGNFKVSSEAGVTAEVGQSAFLLYDNTNTLSITNVPDMGFWLTSSDDLRIHSEKGITISTGTLKWGEVEAYWADNGDGTYTLMGRK